MGNENCCRKDEVTDAEHRSAVTNAPTRSNLVDKNKSSASESDSRLFASVLERNGDYAGAAKHYLADENYCDAARLFQEAAKKSEFKGEFLAASREYRNSAMAHIAAGDETWRHVMCKKLEKKASDCSNKAMNNVDGSAAPLEKNDAFPLLHGGSDVTTELKLAMDMGVETMDDSQVDPWISDVEDAFDADEVHDASFSVSSPSSGTVHRTRSHFSQKNLRQKTLGEHAEFESYEQQALALTVRGVSF
jgi:hypothetical protein